MGIRKGWALCGAREKHCFISHAVSSHPLLELQTLGLFTLFSPHHQDLSLDSIQKKKKIFPLSLHPFLSAFSSFLSPPLFYLPPPPLSLITRRELFGGQFHLSFLSLFLERKREKADPILEVLMVREHTSFRCRLFFVPQLSLLTASLWISFLILQMQMMCVCVWGGPPPPYSSSSVPWAEQEWSGQLKHAEKSRAWGLIR